MQLLEVMNMNNLELLSREGEHGSDGAMIRKELKRREAIGYWKGGNTSRGSTSLASRRRR